MKLENVFKKNGEFIRSDFDPYRDRDSDDKFKKICWDFLFDEDGCLNYNIHLSEFINKNKKYISPYSDIIALYHADIHGSSTKGAYPAIYYWR